MTAVTFHIFKLVCTDLRTILHLQTTDSTEAPTLDGTIQEAKFPLLTKITLCASLWRTYRVPSVFFNFWIFNYSVTLDHLIYKSMNYFWITISSIFFHIFNYLSHYDSRFPYHSVIRIRFTGHHELVIMYAWVLRLN